MYVYIYSILYVLSADFISNNMANAHTCKAEANLVPHLGSDKMYVNSEM